MLKEILKYNEEFVATKGYKPYITDKYPLKRVAIVTCMDARLVELLPAALGFKNGDIKILKNAGGIISHPFGSAIRSLLVAIYSLGVDTVWVIGHSDCGMQHMEYLTLLEKMRERGISQETIDSIAEGGVDYEHWLGGFDCVEEAVNGTVDQIINHPLIPDDIVVEGLLMDSRTGAIKVLTE